MKRNVDDIISIAITLAVTVIFIGQTIATWPSPFRLGKFQLEHHNPISALFRHSHNQSIASNAADK